MRTRTYLALVSLTVAAGVYLGLPDGAVSLAGVLLFLPCLSK